MNRFVITYALTIACTDGLIFCRHPVHCRRDLTTLDSILSSDPIGRRSMLGVAAAVTTALSIRPDPASAEIVYELGPVVLRTDDDPSINPATLPPTASAIDPSTTTLEVTDRCFMKIAADGKLLGVVTFDLYGKAAPATVANFVSLCSGGASASYKGSSVFRVINGINIGMGDIAGGGDSCVKAGTCPSSFQGGPFPAENYDVMHTVSGLVSMARGMDGKVDSRFFVTIPEDARWADGRYTAFGRLGQKDDSMAVMGLLGGLEVTGTKNKPKKRVEIVDCGVL
mmetsp:Transcript_56325/g.105663  ORF Transcript_56325/g.105663 Transcript_56325/m.105663 type:complete len:283 (+) Transcript_56325:115-963(+)